MIPPSTNVAPAAWMISATVAVVAGLMAFRSMKTAFYDALASARPRVLARG
jgi:hypothetical protein